MKFFGFIILIIAIFFGGLYFYRQSKKTKSASGAIESSRKIIPGSGEWITNLPAALKEARASGRKVLVDFSGSDWCGWCIKLDKEVFSKTAFKDFAKKNLVLVIIDFPRSKSQSSAVKAANRQLVQKYGVRGYPTVLLLDGHGKVLLKTGYRPGGPDGYISHLKPHL
jgi:thioredoxin-related protein